MEVDYPRGAVRRFGGSAGLNLVSNSIRSIKRFAEAREQYEQLRKKYKQKASSKKMKVSGYGKGYYKGKFTKPKPVGPTDEDVYLTKGAGRVLETYGAVTGTEIVWVGGSTLEITQLAKCVSMAAYRKLYKKAGIDITNPTVTFQSLLTLPSTFNSGGFRIVRQVQDSAGNFTHFQYSTVTTETLETLVVNGGLETEIINYASATSDLYTVTLRLYQIDNTASADTHRLVSTLNMNNEMVHYSAKMKLVVQNRTKGATGTTDNLDVIDAQPLKGKIYHFKKGNPAVREIASTVAPPNTESLLGRWSNTAVKLVSDTTAGYDFNLSNPPSPYFFQNCAKASNISLEPGDLKEINLSNEIKHYYPRFLRSLAWYSGTGIRRQTIGDCVFVCLEERLNSGSTNPIKVNYECENQISCYFVTNRVNPIVKSFTVQTISS